MYDYSQTPDAEEPKPWVWLKPREGGYTCIVSNPEAKFTYKKDQYGQEQTSGRVFSALLTDIETGAHAQLKVWLEHGNPKAVQVGAQIMKSFLGALGLPLQFDPNQPEHINMMINRLVDANVKQEKPYTFTDEQSGQQVTIQRSICNYFKPATRQVVNGQVVPIANANGGTPPPNTNQGGNAGNVANTNTTPTPPPNTNGGTGQTVTPVTPNTTETAPVNQTAVQTDDLQSTGEQVDPAYNDEIPF